VSAQHRIAPHAPRPRPGFLARALNPVDRLVQAIYSILIVLTFTLAAQALYAEGAFSQASSEVNWVRQLLVATFGCALAWGLIDGVMYILASHFERDQAQRLLQMLRDAKSAGAGRELTAEEVEESYAAFAELPGRQALYDAMYRQLRDVQLEPTHLQKQDLSGTFGVVVVAVGTALPMLVPLALLQGEPWLAVRLSNLIACAMLFWLGYSWAAYSGGRPIFTGLLLLIVGLGMVAIAIPLGG